MPSCQLLVNILYPEVESFQAPAGGAHRTPTESIARDRPCVGLQWTLLESIEVRWISAKRVTKSSGLRRSLAYDSDLSRSALITDFFFLSLIYKAYSSPFCTLGMTAHEDTGISLQETIEQLSADPEREPIASELGGASCLSPWKH